MGISKDNTDKFFNEVSAKVSANLKKATALVEADAKRFAPVLTGTLKRSIYHEFPNKHTALVGSNLEYAAHQELGTSKMAAHPYLRPALAKNLKKIKDLLK